MKIDINQIPLEGLTLIEEFAPRALDLETEIIKFRSPIKVKAEISKITNVINVDLSMEAAIYASCSRCLDEFESDLKKKIKLSLPLDKSEPIIDLGHDIREEIIVDYPIKPLCKADCKGICPKCGKNLNEGGCSCGST